MKKVFTFLVLFVSISATMLKATPLDSVNVTISNNNYTGRLIDETTNNQVFQFYGTSDDSFYVGYFKFNATSVTGTFSESDIDTAYTALFLLADSSEIPFARIDGNVIVTLSGNVYTFIMRYIGTDSILYKINMQFHYPVSATAKVLNASNLDIDIDYWNFLRDYGLSNASSFWSQFSDSVYLFGALIATENITWDGTYTTVDKWLGPHIYNAKTQNLEYEGFSTSLNISTNGDTVTLTGTLLCYGDVQFTLHATGMNPEPPVIDSISSLCFTAKEPGATVTFSFCSNILIQTSRTGNWDWSRYNSDTPITLTNVGDKIYFRAQYNHNHAFCDFDNGIFSRFIIRDSIEVSGNIMSLYGPDCPNITLPDYAFLGLFLGCSGMTSAPELPATSLSEFCYYYMFYGCTGLREVPKLPATSLAKFCYLGMFYDCTGLREAPQLPATILAEGCYADMFYGCTGLISSPALSARKLASYCCYEMFDSCTSMTTAPALPATTMAENCYSRMFVNCTGLVNVPSISAQILANNCCGEMFANCSSLIATPQLPATILAECCYERMFDNCISLTKLPTLPAENLKSYCYANMFRNCSSISVNTQGPGNPWQIPSTAVAEGSYWATDMFAGTSGSFQGAPEIGQVYYVSCDTTLSVENNMEELEVSVYPNPAKIGESVNVNTGDNSSLVEVFDIGGKCMQRQTTENGIVSIKELNDAGIYIIKVIKNGNKVIVQKLIVK